ncbi:MAG: acetate--CoA ligase family protein [Treponemataceae bacterium]
MLLDAKTIERIDAVFDAAAAEDRRSLSEPDVYRILEALDIKTPRHVFIADPSRVDAEMLAPFAGKAIVKIVSPDIAHKSKLGGVRKVATDDPLYVRFVMATMKEEVIARRAAAGEENPRIDGFLIAEFIPFKQSIGNEVLIGVKNDPSFGPVTTLSKGGDDAEFFARWYDRANLSLAPLSKEDAQTLAKTLKIRHRYEAMGHPEYCGKIGDALYAVSLLAYQYSFIAKRKARYYLEELDVNPFVFSEDGRFVAVDGNGRFSTSEEQDLEVRRPDGGALKAFFEPEGIAVAGISSEPGKYSPARVIVELLHDLGRTDVFCLNPKGGSAEIGGKTYPLYQSAAALPRSCALYVFAAPAKNTLLFLDAIPDGSAVVLISGLPQELPYEEFAANVARQRKRGIRIIGPNCMGVFFAPDERRAGINTLFIGEKRLKIRWSGRSNTALFTQSGAMGITALERVQNSPVYKSIVSFGNKADVNIPDLVRYFSAEQSVAVMAMYLEGLGKREGRDFFELARESTKPIIVYKAGRTEAGAKAAASHTASMSGDYDIFQAACDQAGVVLIDELPDFYNTIKAFSMLNGKIPRGNRVAGVVNAGLDATMGADQAGSLVPAEYAAATNERLTALNEHGLLNVGSSFLDVTPMTDDVLFGKIVDAVLADPGTDCAFIAVVPHVETLKTTDDVCRDADALARQLVTAAARYGKPVVVSVNSGNHYQGFVQALEEGGLPVFPDIRSAMRALETYCAYSLLRRKNF